MEKTELLLKTMIIEKYGSLKKFCETIDMPWTTLDSILKRGVVNSNITNVIKITKELGIDTESLADGKIIGTDLIIEYTYTDKSEQFKRLYAYYQKLNELGKKEAEKRIEELSKLSDYTSKDEEEN